MENPAFSGRSGPETVPETVPGNRTYPVAYVPRPAGYRRPRYTPPQPLGLRFWGKVAMGGPDECWPWMADRTPAGYGRILINDRVHHANRVAWVLANDQMVPAGMQVCHTCDNPACCNPAHLWIGTQTENQRDRIAKGRGNNLADQNRRKTHCAAGHEFSLENTIHTRQGRRRCRTCAKRWWREWDQRRKGAA